MTYNIHRMRSELMQLRARYDDGAVPPGIYALINRLERDIAWAEHQWQGRREEERR